MAGPTLLLSRRMLILRHPGHTVAMHVLRKWKMNDFFCSFIDVVLGSLNLFVSRAYTVRIISLVNGIIYMTI